MFSKLSSLARSSVIALAALATVATAAPAAPLGPTVMPAVADSGALKPTLVQGEGRDKWNPAYQVWPRRNFSGRNWSGRSGRNWDNRRAFRRDRYSDYRPYRRHWRGNRWGRGSAFALGLGFGVPLGYYGGYYDNYYDPYYAAPVYRPRVIQRRVYNNYRGYNNYRRYDSEESRNHCGNAYITGPRFFRCDR
jgi:hypothetical protein